MNIIHNMSISQLIDDKNDEVEQEYKYAIIIPAGSGKTCLDADRNHKGSNDEPTGWKTKGFR